MIKGKVWKYGNNINTDGMYPGKYLVHFGKEEVAKHAMEGIDKDFASKVTKGDIIVAGSNFGTGSAREQAAMALAYAGISAVIADSFNRTFYRNAFNNGLLAIPCEGISEKISQGDILEIDIEAGLIKNLTTKEEISIDPVPEFMLAILAAGGAIPYYKERL